MGENRKPKKGTPEIPAQIITNFALDLESGRFEEERLSGYFAIQFNSEAVTIICIN